LLAVVTILIVVSSIVLANNNRFGGKILLENLAYDIALSIRQAQSYGISVQRSVTGTYSSGYGMHFDTNDDTHYVLFVDLNRNGLFDTGIDRHIPPSPYAIGRGFKIDAICVPADGACNVRQATILFRRPEPDAAISTATGNQSMASCLQQASACRESVRIRLISPRNDLASVVIEATGQISVRKGE